jgi:hypothetical protein
MTTNREVPDAHYSLGRDLRTRQRDRFLPRPVSGASGVAPGATERSQERT